MSPILLDSSMGEECPQSFKCELIVPKTCREEKGASQYNSFPIDFLMLKLSASVSARQGMVILWNSVFCHYESVRQKTT